MSASSHSRVKTLSTLPPLTTTSAGSSPRATAIQRGVGRVTRGPWLAVECRTVMVPLRRRRPMGGAELAGDAPRRLQDGGVHPPGEAARKDHLGGVDDADRPDRMADVVEDRRGDARLAQPR